ncbi:Hypothetical predicted protein [Lecanosticta acicola]|uniref:NADP-dependent oxidoreductase domain-containing protein n=1 Tax=Lecanosticta acicola TaxID=111012 RepID=A0AAI8Z397_9PEZI|nr:Hypothetical predicted protein [Lecanosticta acicola]
MASKMVEKAKDALHMNNTKDDIRIAGKKVHHTGYGLMGLTWRANPPPAEQSYEAMKTALDSGANFWNGGELYGTPERNSAHLLREYFEKHPKDADRVVLSIKGGLVEGGLKPDGSEENTRRSIEATLAVLDGIKKIDVWEAARVDPQTPIEITMRTANEYVKAGKIGGIALSECSADTIRRAVKEVHIVAVEVEFSMWETTILDNDVAKVCAQHNIPIVAYSPLGRGFLTGQITKPSDIPADDMRSHLPRFQPENFDKNLEMVRQVEALAKKKNATPGQVALAWVRAQSNKPGMPLLIPIPGASSAERVRENCTEIELSENDIKEIDSIVASVDIAGERYPEAQAALSFGDSPPLQE